MNNDVKHKLYRDLQPGETVQAGDLWRLADDSEKPWETVTADDIAEAPAGGRTITSVEESGIEYRRPVDAVPREEYDKLRQQLADELAEHARTMHGREGSDPVSARGIKDRN